MVFTQVNPSLYVATELKNLITNQNMCVTSVARICVAKNNNLRNLKNRLAAPAM